MKFDLAEFDEFPIHKFSVPGSDLYFEANIAGYAGCIWVLFLGTAPEHRRQGRARALLKALHEHAASTGARVEHGCYTEDGKKYLKHINDEYEQRPRRGIGKTIHA